MVGRAKRLLVIALAGLAGCGNASTLLHHSAAKAPRSTTTTTATRSQGPSAQSVYLAQLGEEQARLAAAEARIPTAPRTPAELGHSIELLTTAVRGLADGLAAIRPPPSVAGQHAHLVAIMRAYVVQLEQAARIAVQPRGEARAGSLLINATTQASQAFTATIAAIDSTLGRSPS
jgi:hypothetical protein